MSKRAPARTGDRRAVAIPVEADGSISSAEQKRLTKRPPRPKLVERLKPEDAKSGRMIFNAPASYWLDLRGYDPPAAKAVTQPMLILQGERDFQVTMDEFAKWKTLLAGKPHVTTIATRPSTTCSSAARARACLRNTRSRPRGRSGHRRCRWMDQARRSGFLTVCRVTDRGRAMTLRARQRTPPSG